MTEYRRILLDGWPAVVTRDGDRLHARDGRSVPVEDAQHLPPTEPRKIICVHLNYISRVDEFMTKLPATPTYFHKPVSALCGHRARVVRPERCRWLNYEGEIAIVIGRHCRNIARDEAGEYIAGYAVANDYGLHDFRDTDAGSMLRVKGSDTLCPVGPALVTGWDFHGKRIRTFVTARWCRTATPTRWSGTCTTSSPTSPATSPWSRATCCSPAPPPTAGRWSRATWWRWRWRGSGRLENEIVHGPAPIRDDVGAQPTSSEEVVSTALGGDWEFRGIGRRGGRGRSTTRAGWRSEGGQAATARVEAPSGLAGGPRPVMPPA